VLRQFLLDIYSAGDALFFCGDRHIGA
jgi:hypothetical protein